MSDYKKEYEVRNKRLKDLSKLITLGAGKVLTKEKKQEVENWENRLEFRLDELVAKSKLEELDIKINVYEEVLKILK